ncbi:C2 domain-containing protein [Balamuthia mandrillaris]
MPKLEVIVSGANFKRMDLKAYGVTDREAYVKLSLGDQEVCTTKNNCPTLDPTWDETFTLEVADPEKDKLTVAFFLGGNQIGQPADYLLSGLIQNKATYKGMAVVGGKVDMMFRALDFGKEEVAEEDEGEDFLEFL